MNEENELRAVQEDHCHSNEPIARIFPERNMMYLILLPLFLIKRITRYNTIAN
jgi:hypothetical protein